MKLPKSDQKTLLRIKSLLNHLDYLIKEEDIGLIAQFRHLCRTYCSWGEKE